MNFLARGFHLHPRLPEIPYWENQWHYVDFVPLTVAGQRRSLTGFLPLMDVNLKE